MTTAFKELAGSPVETYGPDGMKAQRRILVAWENRHGMVAELLGDGYEFGGTQPAQYPDRPYVLAMCVKLHPWPKCPDEQGAFADVAAQINSYSGKYAEIVVDYELLDAGTSRSDLPEHEEETFLTYRMDFGGEYVELPSHSLVWTSDATIPVPPEAVSTVRVPITEHHVTWHRVVNPPWQAIRDAAGTVNQAAFLGAAAETVLFDGATAEKQFIGIDDLMLPEFGWRITYVFREKAIKYGGNVFGWNHAYRSLPHDAPGWDKLKDGNNENRYQTSDFTTLFQFATTT